MNLFVPESLSVVFPRGLQLRDLLLFEGVEGDLSHQGAGEPPNCQRTVNASSGDAVSLGARGLSSKPGDARAPRAW